MKNLLGSFIVIMMLSVMSYSIANGQGTIPPLNTYLPTITNTYHSPKEIFSGEPLSFTLQSSDAPWHTSTFVQAYTTTDYTYGLRVFENLAITQTQNFQLASEVFILKSVKDAKDGYDSLQLTGYYSRTYPYIADDALYTEILIQSVDAYDGFQRILTASTLHKGILKARIGNVVWVITAQGYDDVFDPSMIFSAFQVIKERL